MTLVASEPETMAAAIPTRRAPVEVLLPVICLAFAALGLRPLADPDVWWHLRTGELVVEQGFTISDPWSFASTEPWILHEWGTEVLMYLSYAAAGYRGVIILHATGMLILAAIMLRSIRRDARPVGAVLIGALALVGVFLGTAERPQLVSWCLLAAVLPALRRAIHRRAVPWWLVPVTAMWCNLHGLWIVPLVVYAAMVMGLVSELGVSSWRQYIRHVYVGLACAAAACINPAGPQLLLTPLHVRTYAGFVAEWNAPTLLNPFFGASFALLGLVFVKWARRPAATSTVDIAYVLSLCVIALPYIRTMPILAIGLAPIAAAAISPRTDRPQSRGYSAKAVAARASVVALTLAAAGVWTAQVPSMGSGAPFAASDALDRLPGRAHVLNDYVLGGWLLWTARDSSPAVDGRTEIYDPTYLERALGALAAEPHWKRFAIRHDIDAAWVGKDSSIAREMRRAGWTVHFKDADSLILIPPRA